MNGPIARANGVNTLNDQVSAFIFVADEDGSIHAVWSETGVRSERGPPSSTRT